MADITAPASATQPLSATAAQEEPATRTVLLCVIALALIWGAYFSIANTSMAITHDMAEAYAWGQEFQLGYNQHPPFWAWICGLWFLVFPHTQWAFSFLSSSNCAIGLWGAWTLIGDFVSGPKRLAAWAMLLLVPAATFYAYKYDANTIFLSIWPWTLHWFLRSLRTRGLKDAAAFGAGMGMALMSKYYALILAATCLLAVLQHPSRRRYFASPAPYAAACVTLLLCVPHIWWLFAHSAPPIRYLESKTGWPWWYVSGHAAKTLVDAAVMHAGLAVPFALTRWWPRSDPPRAATADRRGPGVGILATLSLAPVLLTVACGLAIRTPVTLEMTVATFPLLPLLAIELAGVRDVERLCRISVRLAVGVCLGSLALSPAIAYARTWMLAEGKKVVPFQEVALAATRLWHDRVGTRLAYVTGSAWYENETAFYSPDSPHAFTQFDLSRSLWVTPEKLAHDGLLSICLRHDTACLADTAALATPETTRVELTLAHRFWGHAARPETYVLTVIPPHKPR